MRPPTPAEPVPRLPVHFDPVHFDPVHLDPVRLEPGRAALAQHAGVWSSWLREEQATSGPDFVGCWFDTIGARLEPVLLVVRSTTGEPLGLLPLARSRAGTLTRPGGTHGGSHGDVVAAPGHERPAAAAIVDALLRLPGIRLAVPPTLGWLEEINGYELHGAIVECDRA